MPDHKAKVIEAARRLAGAIDYAEYCEKQLRLAAVSLLHSTSKTSTARLLKDLAKEIES